MRKYKIQIKLCYAGRHFLEQSLDLLFSRFAQPYIVAESSVSNKKKLVTQPSFELTTAITLTKCATKSHVDTAAKLHTKPLFALPPLLCSSQRAKIFLNASFHGIKYLLLQFVSPYLHEKRNFHWLMSRMEAAILTIFSIKAVISNF